MTGLHAVELGTDRDSSLLKLSERAYLQVLDRFKERNIEGEKLRFDRTGAEIIRTANNLKSSKKASPTVPSGDHAGIAEAMATYLYILDMTEKVEHMTEVLDRIVTV